MLARAGRYEILRPIASGGMATVYLGRALGAGGFERLVALKVMHPHTATEPEFVAMFLDEARLAARVRHPNVVATIDLVEDPLFLVMDFIDGPTLHTLLRVARKTAKRPLPLDITLRVFLDLLAGLHAAHELTGLSGEPLHLVHRDVSPQNVLVGADGITRITDFGVARAESRITSTRGPALKGKIAYMSPEQIRAEPVDRRSDVYAAGALLWEMLTGQRLYNADNEGALIAKILGGPAGTPRTLEPTVPPELDDACMCALQSVASARYASAAAFAEGLEYAAAAAQITVATSRSVAVLIEALGLRAQPIDADAPPSSQALAPQNTGPRHPPLSPPPASPLPDGAGSGQRRLGPLADMLEPSSAATGLDLVVSDPPKPRPRVPARGLIAGGVAVLVVAGALIASGQLGGTDSPPSPGQSADPPATNPAQPATAPSPTIPQAAPTAVDDGAPLGTAPDSTTTSPSESPSASASSSATPRTTRPSAGTSHGRTQQQRPTSTGTQPKTSPTSFRPTEL